MERKIVKFLEHWKDEPLRKPLVVYGSKQVGKTYTVLEFGEKIIIMLFTLMQMMMLFCHKT